MRDRDRDRDRGQPCVTALAAMRGGCWPAFSQAGVNRWATASAGQRGLDVPCDAFGLVQRRVAPDHFAVLADEELGEVPLDGLADDMQLYCPALRVPQWHGGLCRQEVVSAACLFTPEL